jgi:Peptidase C13 family
MIESGAAGYHFHALVRNLAAGARLALFLRVRAYDYRVSAADLALLLAFNFAFMVAASAARAGFAGSFNPSVTPIYLASVALVLAAAMLVSLAYREPARLLLLAVALCASDPVFELAAIALPFLIAATGIGAPLYFLFLGWMLAVAIRAVAVCAGKRRPHVLFGALAVTAMLAIAQFALPRVDAWQAPQEESDDDAPLADERLFHLQGELIERALAGIGTGTPGKPELYFVGFAPDASSDVFVREMRFVKRLFDERFGTAGRSIALASSRGALEEFAIASVTNLQRALRSVGRRMNADEDVLFLFLSAHGDKQHYLSAEMPPLVLTPLSPTALARMLQDAGIKYRVIVVSACYSGGFIEPLRDANTLIITASAADRSSFGCEPGRDFTYFGEAYFRSALAKTRSFSEAFGIARDLVDSQERSEKLAPSRPQMELGDAISKRLGEL